jgi:hypothetical protein
MYLAVKLCTMMRLLGTRTPQGRDIVGENTETPGVRRINAAEANRLAQQFDNDALGIDGPVREIPTENRTSSGNVDDEPAIMDGRPPNFPSDARPFPPDIDGNTTIGGTPEEQEALRLEETQ